MSKPYPPIDYAGYLQLERLLGCQSPRSATFGRPAHDEMLFIVVHQTYELWFKQVLHELGSVVELFRADSVDEKSVGVAVSRLQRVTEIQTLMIDQIAILETMTPLDFLDFRDMLLPASGFQSVQFRLLEGLLGLRREQRIPVERLPLDGLPPEQKQALARADSQASLFELVEKWLERTPFLELPGYQFWASYREAVEAMLAGDRLTIEANPTLPAAERALQLRELDATAANFAALLDEEAHRRLIAEGRRRLSHRATLAALLIHLYRDRPILHQPFRLLTLLVDVDERLSIWRYRHAAMAHRMIGTKIGTGGSAGHHYLMGTVERNRIFTDLVDLSTYLIPRSSLPALPPELERRLGFYFPRE